LDDPQLPPDLRQLQRDLARRPLPDPPAALRRRVLARALAELRARPSSARWAFAAKTAAAVLLWINLSISATATTNGAPPRPPGATTAAVAEQIRRALPDLPPRDALACARLLRAGANLPPFCALPHRPGTPRP
jgi:hypothetical protein